MFKEHFPDFTADHDQITCTVDGFDCIAWTERDDDETPPPDRQDGYWPSLNPHDPGYTGPKSRRALARHMRRARAILAAWRNDDWDYCGVCIRIYRAGVPLTDKYDHALWSVERNYPVTRRGRPRNAYLRDVANELLPEALDAARAKLAELSAPAAPAKESV